MSKKNTILESIQHIFFDYEITTSDFKESEAFEFYKIILENRTMISLMTDNYYELNKTLKIHDQVIEYSEFDHNIKNKHKLQKKITRQFSNYLQSLFSIVDYNRRIIEKIIKQNTSVNDIYLKRKEDFKKNKYHKLISDFRNYYAHFTYLKIGSEISYINNSMHPTKSIIIYKIDLLSDTGLSS